MNKLLLILVLSASFAYSQKIRFESDQFLIYYPKAYEGDDDGLEPEEYKKVESLYDTIFSIGYKDYYLAVDRSLGKEKADFFYTAYGSNVCVQIPNDSITYFWQEQKGSYNDKKYFGSTSSGRLFEFEHDPNQGESGFYEIKPSKAFVCRNLKTMKEGLFNSEGRITGFIYDKIQQYTGKYSPHIFVGEDARGYEVFNVLGEKLTAEPVDGYSNNGFFYTSFWTKVWNDGKYGIITQEANEGIAPQEFYAPFHCLEGSLGEQSEIKANKDAKVNKYTYNMGGLAEWYCFPMSRKWRLDYFPVPKGDKVGLIDIKSNEVLPFEYEELYSYHVVGSEEEFFVVGKKSGEWLIYNNSLEAPKTLAIDSWVNYGDCVGDDDYYADAFVIKDGLLQVLDINTYELSSIGLDDGKIKAVQNAHGLFALFDHRGKQLRDFSDKMIIDQFQYFVPEENDTGFVLMNPTGGRAFPDAVSHITPSYTKGMYLLHQGEKAGIYSVEDYRYIPISKSLADNNYFSLDGGYANLRLDVAYMTSKDSLFGVVDFRNNTLLEPVYERVYWSCDYKKEQPYDTSNTELITAVGYKNGKFYLHNSNYDALKQIKADRLLEITAHGAIFMKKDKVFMATKSELKKMKGWDYGDGQGLATPISDYRDRKQGYGLIDSTGEVIIPLGMKTVWERDYGSDYDPYLEVVTQEGKTGMYNLKGEVLLEPIYDEVLAVIGKRYDRMFVIRQTDAAALVMIFPTEGRVKFITEMELEDVRYKRGIDANVLYYLDGSTATVDREGNIERLEGPK